MLRQVPPPPPLHLFQAELRKLEKTSEDVEMITAIAKREVSVATERVIAKMQQQEKQLIESLEMTRRRRIKRINSAKQELESLVKQINEAAEFAENLVQRRSAADIIQNKNKLRQKLDELRVIRGVEVPKHRQATLSNLPPHRNTTLNWVLFGSPRSRQSQLNQL